jgi:hypothetical protein
LQDDESFELMKRDASDRQALYSKAFDTPAGECLCGASGSEDSLALDLKVTNETTHVTVTRRLAICPDCQPFVESVLPGEMTSAEPV